MSPNRVASLLLLIYPVCVGLPARAPAASSPAVPAPATGGVVFVANGAGGSSAASENLGCALGCAGLPLTVEVEDWSRGVGLGALDLIDHGGQRAAGRCLACRVTAYRQAHPGARVYLFGHSTGCAVVLAAAECLPPGSVDRIILLAPSVSPQYDLRPALTCAAEGIDSFHSHRDFLLGFCVPLVGTADRRLGRPAGVHGFRPAACCAEDSGLYVKLREHPWQSDMGHTGHFGGHYSCCATEHLRCFVVPLLAAPRPSAAPAAPPAPAVARATSSQERPALAAAPGGGVLASYQVAAPAPPPVTFQGMLPLPESLGDPVATDSRDTTMMPGYPGRSR